MNVPAILFGSGFVIFGVLHLYMAAVRHRLLSIPIDRVEGKANIGAAGKFPPGTLHFGGGLPGLDTNKDDYHALHLN